jgi:hypothetical protein
MAPYAAAVEPIADAVDYIEMFYNDRCRRDSTLGYRASAQFADGWNRARHQRKIAA